MPAGSLLRVLLFTLLLCAAMYLIGRFAPAPNAGATAPRTARAPVDLTPWPGLRLASVAVALAAIALYFALWRLAGTR